MNQHAVVIGASMGGLLAARALAGHYAQVTVLERDIFPAAGENRKIAVGGDLRFPEVEGKRSPLQQWINRYLASFHRAAQHNPNLVMATGHVPGTCPCVPGTWQLTTKNLGRTRPTIATGQIMKNGVSIGNPM